MLRMNNSRRLLEGVLNDSANASEPEFISNELRYFTRRGKVMPDFLLPMLAVANPRPDK